MILSQIPLVAEPGLSLPPSLKPLEDLARNMRWTWRPQTKALFERIFPAPWAPDATPLAQMASVQDWSRWAGDEEFVSALNQEAEALKGYMAGSDSAWFASSGRSLAKPTAYFCAEYCLHETMNQYAGGLGILAGDHVKEASDLGLPFVAVGLFYRRGFFHQIIDFSGRQEAFYPTYTPEQLGLHRVADPATMAPLKVSLPLPGRPLWAAVWLAKAGRTPLLLLDADLPENRPEDRKITSQLYTGGREMRLLQEFVLGAGGVRVLRALGIEPGCWHMNEGHSAFLLLERLREKAAGGKAEDVRATSLITIHTPVPEGNEMFDAEEVLRLIAPLCQEGGLDPGEIVKLGLGAAKDKTVFDMTAFALRHSAKANGVSLLHGRTADKTWHKATGLAVTGITNGVHMPSWIGAPIRALLEEKGAEFGDETRLSVNEAESRPDWSPADEIDDQQLWEAHLAQKKALIAWASRRMLEHRSRLGEGASQLAELLESLDPDALLIGFARRFATYKRAGLMFASMKRITRLMNAKGRRVQVLFAGKSHPHDRGGQAVIEKVFKASQSPRLKGRVFLLEDYDMECGRMLVQGVDLWLNNPRRPLEASGTSGMKAAANGIPNASILDGWWDEACVEGEGCNGWAIGGRSSFAGLKEQDASDAEALYKVLEESVIPAFFDRDEQGVPRRWTAVMKRAIATSLYSFSTKRMLRDYVDEMYKPCTK